MMKKGSKRGCTEEKGSDWGSDEGSEQYSD